MRINQSDHPVTLIHPLITITTQLPIIHHHILTHQHQRRPITNLLHKPTGSHTTLDAMHEHQPAARQHQPAACQYYCSPPLTNISPPCVNSNPPRVNRGSPSGGESGTHVSGLGPPFFRIQKKSSLKWAHLKMRQIMLGNF